MGVRKVDFRVCSVDELLVEFGCMLSRVWVEWGGSNSSLHTIEFAPEMPGGGVGV